MTVQDTATLNNTYIGSVYESLSKATGSFWTNVYEGPTTPGVILNWTVARTGSGFEYASACNAEHSSYSQYTWNFTSSISLTEWLTMINFTASTTTLCDGIGRVLGSLTPTASSSHAWTARDPRYPGPAPSCSIATSDCMTLKSRWSSVLTAYDNLALAIDTVIILDRSATAVTMGNSLKGFVTTFLGSQTSGHLPTITIDGSEYTAEPGSSFYLLPSMPPQFNNRFLMQTLNVPGSVTMVMSDSESGPWPLGWAGGWQEPLCSTPAQNSSTCSCYINGGTVQLYYFSQPRTASGIMCDTAFTDEGTACPFGLTSPGPSTGYYVTGAQASFFQRPCSYYPFNLSSSTNSGASLVSEGYTFYTNKAYISLEYISAFGCSQVGKRYSSTIIEVPSSHVYSIIASNTLASLFNFADLDSPVRAGAWKRANWCDAISSSENGRRNMEAYFLHESSASAAFLDGASFPNFCELIVDQAYAPTLAVPPEVFALDPAWSTCALDLIGFFDPPKALTAETTAASPTVPTTSAAPASTLANPAAPKTQAPYATSASSTMLNSAQIAPAVPAYPTASSQPLDSLSSVSLEVYTSSLSNISDVLETASDLEDSTYATSASSMELDPAQTVPVVPIHSPAITQSSDSSSFIPVVVHTSSSSNALDVLEAAASDFTASPAARPISSVVIVGSAAFTLIAPSPNDASSDVLVAADESTLTIQPGTLGSLAGQSISAVGSGGVVIGGGAEAITLLPSPTQGLASPSVDSFGDYTYIVAASQSPATTAPSDPTVESSAATYSGFAVDASSTERASFGETAISVGSHIVYASQIAGEGSSAGFVVNDKTLLPGGATITIDGTPIAAETDGLVIEGTRTIFLPVFATAIGSEGTLATAREGPAISGISSNGAPIDDPQTTGDPRSATSVQAIAIGSEVLSVSGEPLTVNGVGISAVEGAIIVDGTETIALSTNPSASVVQAVITLSGETLTATQSLTQGKSTDPEPHSTTSAGVLPPGATSSGTLTPSAQSNALSIYVRDFVPLCFAASVNMVLLLYAIV
ncbi:hypothetical protein LTR56_002603 [Elasticomyces elasticus]|nr:hypothetical protein LTR22_013504 [Elasticomyces elasticus]KAK3657089.1 hypothetical protein LTR56_002603 [Elasticomyces elasticus]KAK4926682.1 hypothetical protein LTR49_006364 [Elasticomyces elasticus]KAK5762367.1 hypothetical protein LTS12_007526 [Elasticomyces elasticus]